MASFKDGNKFKTEVGKFYKKHWKTKHYIFKRSVFHEKIVPLARELKNYPYALKVFESFK